MIISQPICLLCLLITLLKETKQQEQSIPKDLLECYIDIQASDNDSLVLPMEINTFIDILRKIESSPYFISDMGSLVNALLRRFWRDGIELDKRIIATDPYFIPYRITGFEHYKYDLITKYMLPETRGHADFGFANLTRVERCTLHRMLSRSVDVWERGDEFHVCENYLEIKTIDADGYRKSSCPIEKGIVSSGTFGTVSLSNILLAITGNLKPMQIPLIYILENKNFINGSIDNGWITLSGDMCEMLINQFPLKSGKYSFGPGGKWNDTDVPVDFYMTLSEKELAKQLWHYTDAEILGTIDGLMMAEEARNWLASNNILGLSQLFEAFYSIKYKEYSIRTHACKRKAFFERLLSRNVDISEQVKNFAEVMVRNIPNYINNYSIIVSEAKQLLTEFNEYASRLIWKQIYCPEGVHSRTKLNLNLVIDSTWTPFRTLKFLMTFGKQIDVSLYGSKMSVIKGDNGKLIIDSSNSLRSIYQKWRTVRTLDVSSLSKSLITLRDMTLARYEDITEEPFTHVTLFLAASTIVTERDLADSMILLSSIRKENPDMYFVYVTSASLAPMYVKLTSLNGSKNDKIVAKTTESGILEDVIEINEFPRAIRPRKCINTTEKQQILEISGYANTGIAIFYRIHPCYLTQNNLLTFEVKNSDKGNIVACIARDERETAQDCKEASIIETVIFTIRNPCPSLNAFGKNMEEWNDGCRPVFIKIFGKRSFSTCTDQTCRMPSDIPFSLAIHGLLCLSGYPHCNNLSQTCKYNMTLLFFMLFLWFELYQTKLISRVEDS